MGAFREHHIERALCAMIPARLPTDQILESLGTQDFVTILTNLYSK